VAVTEVGEVLGEVSLPDPDAGVMLALTPWASLRWAPRGIFPLKAAFGQSGQGDLT